MHTWTHREQSGKEIRNMAEMVMKGPLSPRGASTMTTVAKKWHYRLSRSQKPMVVIFVYFQQTQGAQWRKTFEVKYAIFNHLRHPPTAGAMAVHWVHRFEAVKQTNKKLTGRWPWTAWRANWSSRSCMWAINACDRECEGDYGRDMESNEAHAANETKWDLCRCWHQRSLAQCIMTYIGVYGRQKTKIEKLKHPDRRILNTVVLFSLAFHPT